MNGFSFSSFKQTSFSFSTFRDSLDSSSLKQLSFQAASFKHRTFQQESFSNHSITSSFSFTSLKRQPSPTELSKLDRSPLQTASLESFELPLRIRSRRSIPPWKVAFDSTFQRGSAKRSFSSATLTDCSLGSSLPCGLKLLSLLDKRELAKLSMVAELGVLQLLCFLLLA